ncbi:MAG: hypothetical protein SF162_09755 [bacterium]|nr:hypothetical protein [bacterium]
MAENNVEDAFAAHHQMLEKIDDADNPTAFVPEIQTLIERMRRMGTTLRSVQSRDHLSSLITFWGNYVYNLTRIYPETALYPLDPSVFAVRPPALQAFSAAPSLNAPATPLRITTGGAGMILVSLLSPLSGTTLAAGSSIVISGMYVNLRPEYRVYCFSESADGRLTILDGGYSPRPAEPNGTWSLREAVTFTQPGLALLGVLLAVTPDAARAAASAFDENVPLAAAPVGAIPFSSLAIVTVQAA